MADRTLFKVVSYLIRLKGITRYTLNWVQKEISFCPWNCFPLTEMVNGLRLDQFQPTSATFRISFHLTTSIPSWIYRTAGFSTESRRQGGIFRGSSPPGRGGHPRGDKPNRRGPLLSPGDSRGGQALTGGTPIFAAVVTNFFKISIFIFTFLPFFWLNFPVPPSPPPCWKKIQIDRGRTPIEFFSTGGDQGNFFRGGHRPAGRTLILCTECLQHLAMMQRSSPHFLEISEGGMGGQPTWGSPIHPWGKSSWEGGGLKSLIRL